MKFNKIFEQQEVPTQYYDLGKDFISFNHSVDSSIENIKNKFEQIIASKIRNKKIKARASRGYKQFKKDYEINVLNVSIDDYYGNYVMVAKDSKGKEYFLEPGFKVQIVGNVELEPEPETQEPTDTSQDKQSTQQAPQPQPQQPQPQIQQQPKSSIKEENDDISFSKIEIEKDLKKWLPSLLVNQSIDFKQYIPNDGIIKNINGKTTIIYKIIVPVEDIPVLSIDEIKEQLNFSSYGDIKYSLEKFDVRDENYIIIIRKTIGIN